eukprot:411269_1
MEQQDTNNVNFITDTLTSRLHNENTKIRQHNVIEITGLPNYLCEKKWLGSSEWFGYFGEITKIFIDYRNNWAYIMYSSCKNTTNAIKSMNKYKCPKAIKNYKKSNKKKKIEKGTLYTLIII